MRCIGEQWVCCILALNDVTEPREQTDSFTNPCTRVSSQQPDGDKYSLMATKSWNYAKQDTGSDLEIKGAKCEYSVDEG